MARRFVDAHDDVTFVGTPRGLEARLIPDTGIPFRSLPAYGFDRSRPWTMVTSSATIVLSALRAMGMFIRHRPDVVIGFGGYVSIPVGLAAVALGIPLVLHEQNSVPGMANRFLSRFARAVGVTYEESAEAMARPERCEVTGNPVRSSFLTSDRARGRRALDVPGEATLMVVFGGSRGARHLNGAVVARARDILSVGDIHVVHVTGAAEYDTVSAALDAGEAADRWHLYPYIDEMGDVLAAADLVVCRAGATSIAEITVLGLPAVLVPYPYATEDHQTRNAATMAAHGAAAVVADDELDGDGFRALLVELLGDSARRATMAAASEALGRTDAAERVEWLARRVADAS